MAQESGEISGHLQPLWVVAASGRLRPLLAAVVSMVSKGIILLVIFVLLSFLLAPIESESLSSENSSTEDWDRKHSTVGKLLTSSSTTLRLSLSFDLRKVKLFAKLLQKSNNEYDKSECIFTINFKNTI